MMNHGHIMVEIMLIDESWTYNGRNLEIVSNFNYLGTVFNYAGNFALN